MSKLIKELTKEWNKYREFVEKENVKIVKRNVESDKEAKLLNEKVRTKLVNHPYCPVTIPFNDSIFAQHLPLKKVTMEGFMDYLTNKE